MDHSGASRATPPQWQMELLMEKLRQKSNKLNSLDQISKNIKNSLNERRCILDQSDKMHLQKCLDTIQQSIQVNSLQSLVERLEMISRLTGLKLTPGSDGTDWFISSEMFYIELIISPNGHVQECNIHHEGKSDPQSCPEMVESLRNKDFEDFAEHLNGLVSIYQLPNTDKKIKSKAFIALQALEIDLQTMSSTYPHYNDGESIVMRSPFGLLIPRKGGHPAKIVYFISPYDFLDVNSSSTFPNDVDTIIKKKLGSAASILIQGSGSSLNKLQMSTTVNIMKTSDGKSVPRYGTLNATNSTVLPAVFTVNFGKPMPIFKELLNSLENALGFRGYDESCLASSQPILNLITHHFSNGLIVPSSNRGLNVALPDQIHCYYLAEVEPSFAAEGVLLSSISFTLPSQLSQVVYILRQQLLFNTLVASCIRPGTKSDPNCYPFEINALSYKNLTVSFEHPFDDSIVCLEFNLKEILHPLCKLHAPLSNKGIISSSSADIIPTLEELGSKVLQRSLSIPVTLRAIIRRWESVKPKIDPPNPDFHIPVTGRGSNTGPVPMELSCGAESAQGGSQGSSSVLPQGMVVNLNKGATPKPIKTTLPSANFPTRKGSLGSAPSYSISPIPTTTGTPVGSSQAQKQAFMGISNALQMNMLASSYTSGNSNAGFPPTKGGWSPTPAQLQQQQNMLMGLLDQAGKGQPGPGARRKRKGTSTDSQSGGTEPRNLPRPSPSPSPKSPRSMSGTSRSPKRRPSEGSDHSDRSDHSRTPTPHTPSSASAIGLLMSELGLDASSIGPGTNWNIDITPVTSSTSSTTQGDSSENIYSKMLSGFGAVQQLQLQQHLNEMDEMEKKGLLKGIKREPGTFPPKRSISLDSSSLEPEGGGGLQSLLHGSGLNLSEGGDFKPLMTPSLSITPVSSVGSMNMSTSNAFGTTNTSVNSILSGFRPGIEIIPLPNNPVQIPNSITLTPILPKPPTPSETSDRGNSGPGGKEKKGLEGVIKSEFKKERKRKALSEDLTDSPEYGVKQPKLTPFGGAFTPFEGVKKGPGGNLKGLNLKKPTSPSLGKSGAGNRPNPKGAGSAGKPSNFKFSTSPNSSGSQPGPTSKNPTKGLGFSKERAGGPKRSLSAAAVALAMPSLKAIGGSSGDTSSSGSFTPPNIPNLIATSSAGGSIGGKAGAELLARAQAAAAQAKEKKKVPLLSIIDKLNKQHSVETSPNATPSTTPTTPTETKDPKKDMGKIDYLKASSNITSDVNAMTSKRLPPGSPGSGPNNPNNPEYSVKPGQGLGLKMTINKAKLGGGSKDKLRGGLKGIGKKSSGPGSGSLKLPSSPGSKFPGFPGSPKSGGKKGLLNKDGKGAPGTSGIGKGKSDAEDLTKKLFMPGSAGSGLFGDTPKFDPKGFQIPKKSKAAGGDAKKGAEVGKDAFSEMPKLSAETITSTEATAPITVASTAPEVQEPPPPKVRSSPVRRSSISAEDGGVSSSDLTEEPTISDASVKDKGTDEEKKKDEKEAEEPMELTVRKELDFTSPESPDPQSYKDDKVAPLNIPTTPPQQGQTSCQSATPSPPFPKEHTSSENSQTQEKSTTETAFSFSPGSGKGDKDTPVSPSKELPTGAGGGVEERSLSIDSSRTMTPPPQGSSPTPATSPPPLQQPQVATSEASQKQKDEKKRVVEEDDDEDRLVMDLGDGEDKGASSEKKSQNSALTSTMEEAASGNGNPTMLPPPPKSTSGASVTSPQSSHGPIPSPKPFPAVSSPSIAASVHIVHSPRPPSSPAPILASSCRSPLVVQSPHSSHASPYAIDDDLMDEAVCGNK